MHIPDGFLTASVTGITWAGAGLGVAAALRAVKADPNPMPAGIRGATAAFVFAAQMINIPVAPGISGHLVGAALSIIHLLTNPNGLSYIAQSNNLRNKKSLRSMAQQCTGRLRVLKRI